MKVGCRMASVSLIAALSAGCTTAALKVDREYESSPEIIVPTAIVHMKIHNLVVRFHPTDQQRAAVLPKTGEIWDVGFFKGPYEWSIRIDEIRSAYWDAVAAELLKRGRSCVPANFKPYQDLLLIEFRFTCES